MLELANGLFFLFNCNLIVMDVDKVLNKLKFVEQKNKFILRNNGKDVSYLLEHLILNINLYTKQIKECFYIIDEISYNLIKLLYNDGKELLIEIIDKIDLNFQNIIEINENDNDQYYTENLDLYVKSVILSLFCRVYEHKFNILLLFELLNNNLNYSIKLLLYCLLHGKNDIKVYCCNLLLDILKPCNHFNCTDNDEIPITDYFLLIEDISNILIDLNIVNLVINHYKHKLLLPTKNKIITKLLLTAKRNTIYNSSHDNLLLHHITAGTIIQFINHVMNMLPGDGNNFRIYLVLTNYIDKFIVPYLLQCTYHFNDNYNKNLLFQKSEWFEEYDDNLMKIFYYNYKTNESQWNKPLTFVNQFGLWHQHEYKCDDQSSSNLTINDLLHQTSNNCYKIIEFLVSLIDKNEPVIMNHIIQHNPTIDLLNCNGNSLFLNFYQLTAILLYYNILLDNTDLKNTIFENITDKIQRSSIILKLITFNVNYDNSIIQYLLQPQNNFENPSYWIKINDNKYIYIHNKDNVKYNYKGCLFEPDYIKTNNKFHNIHTNQEYINIDDIKTFLKTKKLNNINHCIQYIPLQISTKPPKYIYTESKYNNNNKLKLFNTLNHITQHQHDNKKYHISI